MAMMAIRPSRRPYSTMPAPRWEAMARRACNRAKRASMLIGGSPSVDVPKPKSRHRDFPGPALYRLEIRLIEAAVHTGELGRHAVAERLDGHDGDDGDQGEEQAVFDHAGTPLSVEAELRLEPGLEDEEVHQLVEGARDRGELGGDAAAEGLDGHDGDDGDQGEEQAVLDHAGTGLVVGVELGLEPGLQNEKVHLISPLVGARGAGSFFGLAPLEAPR